MKLVSQKRSNEEDHKGAIMCGILSTMAVLLPAYAANTTLLRHLPKAFS